ncbi:MAG: MarR family winged helix-turn-helix transcriptional regulator [Euzebya sp.]
MSITARSDEPQWLAAPEQQAWRGYRRMITLLEARIARDLTQQSGLSMPDYEVLSNLSEAEDHRQRLSGLAGRMLWSQSRMSHHISRMEKRGLVAREQVPDDGRGAWLVLTECGMQALVEAAPGHVASVRRHLIDLLDDRQIKTLAQITFTVVEHLDQ